MITSSLASITREWRQIENTEAMLEISFHTVHSTKRDLSGNFDVFPPSTTTTVDCLRHI